MNYSLCIRGSLAALAAVVIAGCGTSGGSTQVLSPPSTVFSTVPNTVRSSATFVSGPKTLEELLERSTLVVRGRVTAVEVGPSRGFEEDRTRMVSISVTRPLLGTVATTTVVKFSESEVTDDGRTIVRNDMRLSAVGDDGIFFLARLKPNWPLAGGDDHAVLRVVGDRLQGPSPDNEESPLTHELEQRSPAALEAEIIALAASLPPRPSA